MAQKFRIASALLAVSLLGTGVFGCDQIADAVGKKAKEEAEKAIKEAGAPGKSPASAGPDLFVDATSIPTKYKEKIKGPVRVMEILVYPAFAKAKIQDPNKKLNADEFEYRGGVVGDGGPLKWIGTPPTEKDLEFQTFNIDEVDFTKVPTIVADAPKQLGYEGGKTTHIMLKRPLPFEKEVRWRVYVDSERRNGSVEYDAKGVFKKKYE